MSVHLMLLHLVYRVNVIILAQRAHAIRLGEHVPAKKTSLVCDVLNVRPAIEGKIVQSVPVIPEAPCQVANANNIVNANCMSKENIATDAVQGISLWMPTTRTDAWNASVRALVSPAGRVTLSQVHTKLWKIGVLRISPNQWRPTPPATIIRGIWYLVISNCRTLRLFIGQPRQTTWEIGSRAMVPG